MTIHDLLDKDYTPTSPAEFIGPARRAAEIVTNTVRDAIAAKNAPLFFLINGQPGLGKSMLAKYICHLLGVNEWSLTKRSGTQMKIDIVEEIARGLQLTNLFGDYRVLQVEEADMIPTVAQVRFLLMMDDMPRGSAVICTSNCKVEDFEKRFQTRFQVFEITQANDAELSGYLRQWPLAEADIKRITCFSGGCVRVALKDALTALQSAPMLKAA